MANESSPLRAAWKSKKFSLTLGWATLCLLLAYQTPQEDVAETFMICGSIVIAAYLLGQGYCDAHCYKGTGYSPNGNGHE